MACVISIINLKGGVAKTTTTVALAETLAARHGKRVLVIDLDPQTNATVMLIGEERWNELNQSGRTLATLFEDALNPNRRKFDVERTLQRSVSDVQGAEGLDLLPSSLDLIDVQDWLASTPRGAFDAVPPTDILRAATQPLLAEYDIVLIDCPPNMGLITLNGLRLSDGYIIPTVPDILSTYGIPQIVQRVEKFSMQMDQLIRPIGVVVTKYQQNLPIHVMVTEGLKRDDRLPIVFQTKIRQANQMAAAAEFLPGRRRTLKQKYGYDGMAERYDELAQELLSELEAVV